MQYGEAISVLRGVPLFSKLDTSKLKLLAFSSTYLTFHEGEELFHQGDPSDGAYIIEEGTVDVIVGEAGNEVKVSSVGRHQLFGEMAIILNQSRTATIRAAEPLTVLKIDGDVFLRLVIENSEAALSVMRSLSQRLADLTERYQQLEHQLEDLTQAAGRADICT